MEYDGLHIICSRYGCYCHLGRGYSARNSHGATREGLEVGGLNMAAVGEENTSSNVSSSTVKKSANPSETHRD